MVLLATFLATTTFAAELEGVKIGVGTLRMGGIFQAWLYATNYNNSINYLDATKYTSFQSKRARFLFWGNIIPDKISYFVQLEMVNSPAFLDYKMMFTDYVPRTTISVGRFLPYWTLFMWKPVSQLELIYYPLVVQRTAVPGGNVDHFAMWRQCGVQTATKFDAFSVYLGLFNGADIPDNTTDNNNAKDFMARLDVHPAMDNMELLVGGEFWLGRNPKVIGYNFAGYPILDPDRNENNTTFGGFLSVDYNQMLKFRGEYLMRTKVNGIGTFNDLTEVWEWTDLKDAGFYAMGGYTPIEWLEILARYDWFDPNTANSADDGTDKDAESWITFGVNYMFLNYNAVIGLNLVKKTEQWKILDNQDAEVNFDNNEAILQFQIAF